MQTEENSKIREAIIKAEKKYDTNIKDLHIYDLKREGRSGIKFTLEFSVTGLIGTSLGQRIGEKYNVKFGQDSYTPEDMNEPLERWSYLAAIVNSAEEVDTGMKRLVEAKKELEKKLDIYYKETNERVEKTVDKLMKE